MAITNAQQFKQLVNPPMKGNKRPGYRGDAAYGGPDKGDGPASSGDRGDRREQRSVAQTLGISPTTQSALGIDDRGTKEQNRNQRELVRAGRVRAVERFINRPTFGFTDAAKFNIAPLPIKFIQGIGNLFTGTTKPVDFSGMDRGGDVPYWAKLGYSSESEYLAALTRAQAPSTTEQETEEPFQLARRFRAEGGIMNSDVVGGEFDFESARQMYGLGKLVKKVTRTVKKIAKSPIGKAAIAAATIKFGGPLAAKFAPGTFGSAAKSPFLRAIGRGQFFGNTGIFSAGKAALFGPNAIGPNVPEGILSNFGVGSAILGASALAGLLTPEQEEEAQSLSRGEGIDIEAARRSILNAGTAQDFRARRFVAEGGSMKEPVAKKTMPLLDLEGQEMDLRAEGGFVPIGRMEKADDVPARLSKNEFVFTADAVRNAGDGDVDKGAEVMYNMMKNLESGGDVSEESQGLEGARKMFQTSQRLEEVL